MKIEESYLLACSTPSDINEHLPVLRRYAEQCNHITEMGVRAVVSTWAFLDARPNKLVGYDIGKYPNVDEVIAIALEEGIDFEFILADVLKIEIEETDFLFIDTFHTASQLERELELHSGKVRKFIGLHDTFTYWVRGEDSYESIAANGVNCGRGLKYALEPFLLIHPEWEINYISSENNGLIILERS